MTTKTTHILISFHVFLLSVAVLFTAKTKINVKKNNQNQSLKKQKQNPNKHKHTNKTKQRATHQLVEAFTEERRRQHTVQTSRRWPARSMPGQISSACSCRSCWEPSAGTALGSRKSWAPPPREAASMARGFPPDKAAA